jgi:hypothetical protein
MSKIYYKVVSENMRSSCSCFAEFSSLPSDVVNNFTVKYKIGEFVYPNVKHSKLYVFESLKDAKYFVSDIFWATDKNTYIYECEVINPKPAKTLLFGFDNINDFWRCKKNKKKISDFSKNDKNDVSIECDAVKLLYKIL